MKRIKVLLNILFLGKKERIRVVVDLIRDCWKFLSEFFNFKQSSRGWFMTGIKFNRSRGLVERLLQMVEKVNSNERSV